MSWFTNLRLSYKFLTISLFLLPFVIGLGGAGIWGTFTINRSLQDVQGQQIPSILNISIALNKSQAVRDELHLALLDADSAQADIHLNAALADLAIANTRLNTYISAPHDAEEARIGINIKKDWQNWLTQTNQLIALTQANTSTNYAQALQILADSKDQEIIGDLANIIKFNETVVVQNKINQSNQTFSLVITIILVTLGCVLAVNGLIVVVLRRFVSTPLLILRRATQVVAAGNLSQQVVIERGDEVGDLARSFNLMTQQLFQRLEENNQISRAVQNLASDLAAITDEQAGGANEQASAVAQVTSSMIQLRETATQIAHSIADVTGAVNQALASAQTVKEVTGQVAQVSDVGRQAVTASVSGIELVRQKIEKLNDKLTTLDESSQQISVITELITNIAKETHLLALNAAIESVSAGEYGQRFGVIATQVKELANRSLVAAARVRETLAEVQLSISTSVLAATEGEKETVSAVELAYQAGEAIERLGNVIITAQAGADNIVSRVATTRLIATHIVLATKQQQSASDMAVASMQTIDILAREVASGSLTINEVVGVLQNLSARLGTTPTESGKPGRNLANEEPPKIHTQELVSV